MAILAKLNLDPTLIVVQLMLYLISIFGVGAADTMPESIELYPNGFPNAITGQLEPVRDEPELLQKHLGKIAIGVLATAIGFGFKSRWAIKGAKILFYGSLLLLVVALLIGVGKGGERRFIEIPVFGQFQPSEVFKFTSLLFLANYFHNKPAYITLVKPLTWIGIGMGMIALGGDLGTGLSFGLVVGLVLVVIGAPIRRLLAYVVALGILGGMGGYLYIQKNGVPDRFTSWYDTVQGKYSSQDGTFQSQQAQKTLLKSGMFGHGIGESMQHRIPQAQDDMVFASLVWAGGWTMGLMVVIGFVIIFIRGINIAYNLRGSPSILAVGMSTYLLVYAIDNISGTIGAIPISGAALPLVSYGGTNMLISGLAMGFLHQLAQTTTKEKP